MKLSPLIPEMFITVQIKYFVSYCLYENTKIRSWSHTVHTRQVQKTGTNGRKKGDCLLGRCVDGRFSGSYCHHYHCSGGGS